MLWNHNQLMWQKWSTSSTMLGGCWVLASDSSCYVLLSYAGRIFHLRPLACQRILKWTPPSPGSHQLVHDTLEGQQLCPGTTLLSFCTLLTSSPVLSFLSTTRQIVLLFTPLQPLPSWSLVHLSDDICNQHLAGWSFHPRSLTHQMDSLQTFCWGPLTVFPLLEPVCYDSISCTERSEWKHLAKKPPPEDIFSFLWTSSHLATKPNSGHC